MIRTPVRSRKSDKTVLDMPIADKITSLRESLPEGVTLVAVSKTHPAEAVREAYDAGQRIFGENRPQEMRDKHAVLPDDIQWHLIGHLQTNKIKYIIGFVSMIHSVDSASLLSALDAQAAKHGRTVDVLLEIHISSESSKEGWQYGELVEWLRGGEWKRLENIVFRGVMGVATNTDDKSVIRSEFSRLREMKDSLAAEFFGERFDTVSMGMTSDYAEAVECGSTMVRIGSLIFGARDYSSAAKL